jgi:hypothetical protein
MLKQIRQFERGIIDDDSDTIQRIRESEREAYLAARNATKALLDATNTMGADKAVVAGVVAGILETHRYLQDQGITAILTALGEFGRMSGQEDARNADAKGTCAMLPEVLRERIYWKD